jgi:septal ring factor EnvC (AmiA/AmiB activator)
MEQYSWDDTSFSNLKSFVKKLCVVFNRHTEKGHYANDLGIQLTKGSTEKILRAKIQQLEDNLEQTKKEKDKALNENRKKIDELNLALLSVKTKIKELIHYKKERDKKLKDLEKKIIETVK